MNMIVDRPGIQYHIFLYETVDFQILYFFTNCIYSLLFWNFPAWLLDKAWVYFQSFGHQNL